MLPQFGGGKFKSNVWYRKKLLEKLKTLAKGKLNRFNTRIPLVSRLLDIEKRPHCEI